MWQETGIYINKIFIACSFLPLLIAIPSASSRILLEKLPLCKLVSKFSAVYGTRIKRRMFTGIRHCCPSYSRDNMMVGWKWEEIWMACSDLHLFHLQKLMLWKHFSYSRPYYVSSLIILGKCTKCWATMQFLLSYVSSGDRDELDSVVGITIRCGLDSSWIEFRWGKTFFLGPDQPRCPPSLVYNGYWVFSGVKAAGT
jgi:hypothetical protein